MRADVLRRSVRIPSGRSELAAWHYPGANGGCVVMAGGLGVTKEPGTDRFARTFAAAGFTVLAFDHRGFGESGGSPRQVAGIRAQLADWRAALAFATRLPGVAPDRIAAWGFSSAGGHVLRIAVATPGLAAAIAQSPNADGRAAARNAARYQTPGAFLRLLGRAVVDAAGGLLGRPPLLVPLAGEPGTVAMLTTPDSRDGDRALDPDGSYGDWIRAVAARSALGVGFYRPGADAPRIRCPLLVVVSDDDRSVLAEPARLAAERAPRGELVRVSGGHYAPFLEAHEQTVAAELDFLRRHLTVAPAPTRTG